jgi:hypothetical protein
MWLLFVIALVVVIVALVAVPLRYRGRSAGGQNTTIIEREPARAEQKTEVVERRYERRTSSDQASASTDS